MSINHWTYDYALSLIRAGLSLIPIDPKTKRPIERLLPQDPTTGMGSWKVYQTRLATEIELRLWVDNGAHFALVCGAISGGLRLLDFDIERFLDAWRLQVDDLADGLVVQRTGGGGYQVAFRCPDPGTNEKLAWTRDDAEASGRTIAIETRGEGGYAVIAPSLHPSGNQYQLLEGDWTAIPTLSQARADALSDAARRLDEAPYTRQQLDAMRAAMSARSQHAVTLNGQGSVIEAYNQATPIEQALRAYGYAPRYGGRWARPGGSSASVVVQNDRSWHHSSNDPLNDNHWHDAFDLFAYYEHGNDARSAARAAAIILCLPPITYNSPTPPAGGQSGQPPSQPPGSPPPAALPPVEPGEHLPLAPRHIILEALANNERGDAQLLAHIYHRRLVYDHSAGAWHLWAGHAWAKDRTDISRLITAQLGYQYKRLSAEIRREIPTKTDPDEIARLAAYEQALDERARKLNTLRRIRSILELATAELAITGDEWDADPWLLGVKNGVIDLRTGQLRPGQPEDYMRLSAPTEWQGLDTPAPRWERFVSEIMSDEPDRVAFLQRLLGYAINGTKMENILGVFVGEQGRNGKRVLFETLGRVLGPYAGAISTDVLVGRTHLRAAGSAQPHLMTLQGKRLAYCSETEEHDRLTAAQVKYVTGGDEIRARQVYGREEIRFTPTHTLFLQTNYRPHAPAEDEALWERVKVIEFKVRFVERPSKPNERPRDPLLEQALLAEAPGILAWLVRGGLAWRAAGGLQPPESVRIARDAYRKGESLDAFLEAACSEQESGYTESSALYAAYSAWCAAERLTPQSQTWFGRQLGKQFERTRTPDGRSAFFGIALERTTFAPAAPTAIDPANPPLGPAIWHAPQADEPVIVTGVAGQQDGAWYYTIHGSATAIPASQVEFASSLPPTPAPAPQTDYDHDKQRQLEVRQLAKAGSFGKARQAAARIRSSKQQQLTEAWIDRVERGEITAEESIS